MKELKKNVIKGVSKRKQKKLLKRQGRFLYRVIHQTKKPNSFFYGCELAIGVFFESIRMLFVFLKWLLLVFLIAGILGGIFFTYKLYPIYEEYKDYSVDLVSGITRDDFRINESSTVYNSDGKVLAVLRENADSQYLLYEDIPQHVVDAFIAVEDRSFWENDGVDYKGIVRVMLRFLQSDGDEVHGASTITQQLVRNNFLSREVKIERKLKEILISRLLTKSYGKKDIMEFYVNNICYANGIYGISGAAKAYFNKDVNRLSLSQIAYLCAIPNRPTYYDPYENVDNAIPRRDKILEDMYECGYITKEELDDAKSEKIVITKPTQVFNDYETTFAVDCAVKYLMKQNGFNFRYSFESTEDYQGYHASYADEYELMKHRLYTGGYKIYTSLDSDVYKDLQAILDAGLEFSQEIDEETGIYTLQGALTVIDNENGKVVALVGGRSQDDSDMVYSLNRAYQSYRQPGSSIKPVIVYAPALEHGYNPSTIVYNIDVSKAKEKGVDAQELTGSAMTLRDAVEKSKNGVAWQVFDNITPQVGMSYVEKMRYSNLCPDDYFNASSLGGFTYGVTTVEQASAYSTLANHGVFREPNCIISIKDSNGDEIYEEYDELQVYAKRSADDMVDILKGVLTRGTASSLRWGSSSKVEAFCKTGTTNGSKDGWLCGATPYYSIAVWVGYDTPKTLSNLWGSTYPGQIWKSAMLYMIDGLDEKKFERAEYSDFDMDMIERGEGYYSYLPGRDDSEVLSDGYTVANYREDRVVGESIYALIEQINALDMSVNGALLEEYYSQACQIIKDGIYSRKYTAEMQGYLDSAYNAKKGVISGTNQPQEVVVP